MAESQFDVLIIGGGQAGPTLAHALASAGKRVGLAERKHLGGSCVNFADTSLIRSEKELHAALERARAEPHRLGLNAVHPQGSCPLGTDPKRSAKRVFERYLAGRTLL
jgi:pyruvate/2-oxoglutarate dehydrogenase complex dihydrolipoamide dehydrogenase (E3) component